MRNRWQMWRFENTPGPNATPEQRVSVRAHYETFKAFRAEIIDGATYVERMLESVLCDAIAGKNEVHRNRVRTSVFAGEGFGFMQKWKALRAFLAESPNWLNTHVVDSSSNLSELHKAISDRNKFAHGELVGNEQTMSVSLTYFEGTARQTELTDAVLEAMLDRMQSVYFWLENLHLVFWSKTDT